MKIDTLSELTKLVDMCRRKGVDEISVDGIVLKLSPTAPKRNIASTQVLDDAPPEWGTLSEEEQLFYSTGAFPTRQSE